MGFGEGNMAAAKGFFFPEWADRVLPPRAGLLGWALGDGHSRELGGWLGRTTLGRPRPPELIRLRGARSVGCPVCAH